MGLSSFPPMLWLKLSFSHAQLLSHLTVCLYAKWSANFVILIGTHEMSIPLASQSGSCIEKPLLFSQLNISRADIPCTLKNNTGKAVGPTPVTLYITVTLASSHRGADEAMKRTVPIGGLNTWQGAVWRIKCVMDMLSPISEVRVMPF